MAHSIELKITKGDLEQVRCSICKGYLSCAPIRLLPDGSNICGRCTPSDNDVLVYREPALEVILNNATFPCLFKQFGCTTCLLFGQTSEHEAKCEYRPITCVALLPYTTCAWDGSIMQISDHFTGQHPDLVKQSAEFKLQIDKTIEGIQMVVNNNCSFIIKYLYDADTINLKYDVQCFTPNVKEEYCKLKLLNSLDPDYSMFLKGCKCVLYNHNFFVAENVTVLDLKRFLENLNNPTIIEFALTLPNYYFSSVARLVDYDLLSSKKCGKCRYYLIPPIYEHEQAIICSNCFYIYPNSTPFNDKELQDLLVDQNFPCRWRGCDFVAKGNTICSHEIECKYRVYSCAYFQSCNINLHQSKLVEHLVGHKYQYFVDVFTYKLRYNNITMANYVFTIVKNEVVVIKYFIDQYPLSEFHHRIEIKTSALNSKQFAVKIYFEHNHCKCISDTFSCNDSFNVYFSRLPTCFKEDEELSVTLSVV